MDGGAALTEHLSLRWVEETPPEKWLILGKYCLLKSGQVPEVVDLLKARGTLQTRPGRPPDAEPQDPLPTPALDALWQQLWAWGQAWPGTLARWLQWGAVRGDPQHWRPGWQGLQRRLQWVHGLVVEWLLGRPGRVVDLDSPTWKDEWRLLALPQFLYGAFPRAAWGGRGVEPPRLSWPDVQDHARLTLSPPFSQLETRVVRTALETERQASLQGAPRPDAQQQGAAAVLARLEAVTPAWQADFTRTVRTELMDAYTQGAVAGLVAEQVAQVYRLPSARACVRCKELYLMPDGAPRVFVLNDLIANGTNEGRKHAEWLPVVGVTHPNCVCSAPLRHTATIEAELFTAMRERAAHA